jgi:O-antigen/teichoic acid export membrane protein
LAIIGSEYVRGQNALVILSLGILPYTIVVNSIAKFNYFQQSKRLLLIGITQIVSFLISFYVLVPLFGIEGAALSILTGFAASAALSIIWLDHSVPRYILVSIIAIFAGWIVAKLVAGLGFFPVLLTTILVTFIMLIMLKNTSISEISYLVKNSIRGPRTHRGI